MMPTRDTEAGFSLPELLLSMLVLSVVIGVATQLLLVTINGQRTTWNRTQMHSSVRGAIELLQQEVGQAGLVALPEAVTLTTAVTPAAADQIVGVSSATGMFVGEQVIIDTGLTQETVKLTAVDKAANKITGTFVQSHAVAVPVTVAGGFADGIVAPAVSNGSSGTVLKLFGDINGDGKMVYVEYLCDTVNHHLSRNMMAWNATSKPAWAPSMILLGNVVANPGDAPCFSYQTETVANQIYVTSVAITLSVRTQTIDPVTRVFQVETKTLLNVSPRNVFNTWQHASIQMVNRVQPMPASVRLLLP